MWHLKIVNIYETAKCRIYVNELKWECEQSFAVSGLASNEKSKSLSNDMNIPERSIGSS